MKFICYSGQYMSLRMSGNTSNMFQTVNSMTSGLQVTVTSDLGSPMVVTVQKSKGDLQNSKDNLQKRNDADKKDSACVGNKQIWLISLFPS